MPRLNSAGETTDSLYSFCFCAMPIKIIPPKLSSIAMTSKHVIHSPIHQPDKAVVVKMLKRETTVRIPRGKYFGADIMQRKPNVPAIHLKSSTGRNSLVMPYMNPSLQTHLTRKVDEIIVKKDLKKANSNIPTPWLESMSFVRERRMVKSNSSTFISKNTFQIGMSRYSLSLSC